MAELNLLCILAPLFVYYVDYFAYVYYEVLGSDEYE